MDDRRSDTTGAESSSAAGKGKAPEKREDPTDQGNTTQSPRASTAAGNDNIRGSPQADTGTDLEPDLNMSPSQMLQEIKELSAWIIEFEKHDEATENVVKQLDRIQARPVRNEEERRAKEEELDRLYEDSAEVFKNARKYVNEEMEKTRKE